MGDSELPSDNPFVLCRFGMGDEPSLSDSSDQGRGRFSAVLPTAADKCDLFADASLLADENLLLLADFESALRPTQVEIALYL